MKQTYIQIGPDRRYDESNYRIARAICQPSATLPHPVTPGEFISTWGSILFELVRNDLPNHGSESVIAFFGTSLAGLSEGIQYIVARRWQWKSSIGMWQTGFEDFSPHPASFTIILAECAEASRPLLGSVAVDWLWGTVPCKLRVFSDVP